MEDTKQQWFKDAKFGLFIHWGLYSILAGEYKGKKTDHIAEWIMNHLNIPVEEYRELAKQFNPVNFDADSIVEKAKEWGMKYIVFTAKHHEGFAMYHSTSDPYNIVDATPYRRDILKELQLACEKYGLRLGLYYSQAQDWDDPNGFMQYRDNSSKDFQAYLDNKVKPQLTELLTGYGKIALIWFDTPMETTVEQSQSLVDLVKSLQPNCIVSGRIGNNLGEYMTTGDNFVPRLPYEGDWELPATLNDTWGFNKDDHNWKSPDEVIKLLLKVNSRGGNYLLNIGPDSLGNVPGGSIDILDAVGKYVQANQDAIFGTKRMTYYPYELDWAEFTQKPHKLFIHILKPKKVIEVINVNNQFTKATILSTNEELTFQNLVTCEGSHMVEVRIPKSYHAKTNYCICLEMKEEDPIFEPLEG
ncbi:MAG TPA: hypothetical protein GXX75_04220 [Clostridiales bacterium]|nr:hypothetical protein [Clostridiales bacterium]